MIQEQINLLNVRAVPGSKITKIIEYLDDGSLKIKLRSKPREGKANQELIFLLSEALDLPKGNIEIASGLRSRMKLIKITGLAKSEIERRIKARMNQDP